MYYFVVPCFLPEKRSRLLATTGCSAVGLFGLLRREVDMGFIPAFGADISGLEKGVISVRGEE